MPHEILHDPTDIPALIRTQLRDLLPRAIACAIASYQDFSAQDAPDDARKFIAYHNACRAALVHVDTLSKMAKWVIQHDPQNPDSDDLQPLVQQARQIMLQMEHIDHTADDGDDDDAPHTQTDSDTDL